MQIQLVGASRRRSSWPPPPTGPRRLFGCIHCILHNFNVFWVAQKVTHMVKYPQLWLRVANKNLGSASPGIKLF